MSLVSGDSVVRQLAKRRRGVRVSAGELEHIRKVGTAALTNSDDKLLFMGMFATIETTLQRLREDWDTAVELYEVHMLDPPFPSADDDLLLTNALNDYYQCHNYNLQLSPKSQPPILDISTPTMLNPSMAIPNSKPRAILPKIQIKRFSGDWAEWPTFKQLFISLIKEEDTLSNGERFQYLVSYLDGPALGVIKHIPVINVNFEQAWDALVRVYDDKRGQASSYLERLLTYKASSGKPTADTLQSYLSQVTESVSSLKNLAIDDMGDYLLCELALRVLDPKTREAFEQDIIGTPFPKFDVLKEFVQSRYQVLRITDRMYSKVQDSRDSYPNRAPVFPNKFSRRGQALLAHSSTQDTDKWKVKPQESCFVCSEQHILMTCPQYKSADPPQRLNLLKQFSGCRNCLHPSHRTNQCLSPFNCRECNGRHHTTLHLSPLTGPLQNSDLEEEKVKSKAQGFSGTNISAEVADVLLGTVVALIQDAHGKLHSIRGLLDPGSQYTMITSKCAGVLNLVCQPHKGAIAGVNNSPVHNIKGKVPLFFRSNNLEKRLATEAIVVPSVTPPLPQTPLISSIWEDYRSYALSDHLFTQPGPISFLIGADLYPEVVTGTPIVIHQDGPRLIDTIFGFTVVGRLFDDISNPRSYSLLTYNDTHSLIERFWMLEEPFPPSVSSPEDARCEQHFLDTHQRNTEGRYRVSLPFKTTAPVIPLNVSQALTRLYSLESKFRKDPALQRDYIMFMKEYEELGHMTVTNHTPKYVIPHHPIYRNHGKDRKIRVVFDASCQFKGACLNDLLMRGPKLQADICNIVLNFRKYRYVFTCDIVKMFRQIEVAPADRCFQHIAWRDDPSKPVLMYQLNTVTYGTRSAPYLAQRVLHQLAHDERSTYPNASEVLLKNIYVDDIAVGCDTPQELFDLRRELTAILQKGCMELSKWASNLPSLLQDDKSTSSSVDICSDIDAQTKILGMKWCPRMDIFSYEVAEPASGLTKRVILSTIARLYDPLGYLAPTIFFAKCIMQETWKQELGWDDDIPAHIALIWTQFTSELHLLSTISISRPFPKSDTPYQLLGFSDASEKGYCAVVYLRAIQDNHVTISILKAKTRLAPLKTLTVPRLELCGALLLSQIIQSLESFRQELNITNIFCFTDSMIVLAWLKTPPYQLQSFISNRVQQITEITRVDQWHHIKGHHNPADVGSRGCLPSALENHPLWWTGPDWCYDIVNKWPLSNDTHGIEVPELRSTRLVLTVIKPYQEFLHYCERHSSWLRLIRVIAYIKRFIVNTRQQICGNSLSLGPLSSEETLAANHHCIRLVQHTSFPDVSSTESLPLELRRLATFTDRHGLIRVGGRLSQAPIPIDQKHPILLPTKSHFTLLLVRHIHATHHHIGPATLLATIRQEYWIPRAKNLIKSVIYNCIVCTRFSRRTITPFMGDLPANRFAGVRPFLVVGVDFAGPFLCKVSRQRNASTRKSYLCIFVCMSSRAYHLELATAMTVEAFLDVFSRFASRRGIPAKVMSDCGSNFRGTANYLQDLKEWLSNQETQTSLIDATSHLNIQWSFNPPAAPHFGGSWEAGVKLVKSLLYKTFGNHPYTQDELSTAFVKIEGILNSRPLQPISDSPDDPLPLTPGHFIIGQALNMLPEPDFSEIPSNRLSRWQLICERVQHFWSRWRLEYLGTLQARNKWLNRPTNLKIGDLVLIMDVNTSASCWPMGRIADVHPGDDGTVRVVTIQTQKGMLKRPAAKLIALPLNPA